MILIYGAVETCKYPAVSKWLAYIFSQLHFYFHLGFYSYILSRLDY